MYACLILLFFFRLLFINQSKKNEATVSDPGNSVPEHIFPPLVKKKTHHTHSKKEKSIYFSYRHHS